MFPNVKYRGGWENGVCLHLARLLRFVRIPAVDANPWLQGRFRSLVRWSPREKKRLNAHRCFPPGQPKTVRSPRASFHPAELSANYFPGWSPPIQRNQTWLSNGRSFTRKRFLETGSQTFGERAAGSFLPQGREAGRGPAISSAGPPLQSPAQPPRGRLPEPWCVGSTPLAGWRLSCRTKSPFAVQ